MEAELEKVSIQRDKANYRIIHLLRYIEELEGKMAKVETMSATFQEKREYYEEMAQQVAFYDSVFHMLTKLYPSEKDFLEELRWDLLGSGLSEESIDVWIGDILKYIKDKAGDPKKIIDAANEKVMAATFTGTIIYMMGHPEHKEIMALPVYSSTGARVILIKSSEMESLKFSFIEILALMTEDKYYDLAGAKIHPTSWNG